MTAPDRSRMFQGLVPGSTYQVTVRPVQGGRMQWNIALLGPMSGGQAEALRTHPLIGGHEDLADADWWISRATLNTPPVTGEQAKAIALAWLVAVEGADIETVDCVMAVWPDGPFERLNDPE